MPATVTPHALGGPDTRCQTDQEQRTCAPSRPLFRRGRRAHDQSAAFARSEPTVRGGGARRVLAECETIKRLQGGGSDAFSASSSRSMPPPLPPPPLPAPPVPPPAPQAQPAQPPPPPPPFAFEAGRSLSANFERLVQLRLQRALEASELTAIRAALDEALSVLQAGGAERRRQLLAADAAVALANPGTAQLWASCLEAMEGEVESVQALMGDVVNGCSAIAAVLFASAVGM